MFLQVHIMAVEHVTLIMRLNGWLITAGVQTLGRYWVLMEQEVALLTFMEARENTLVFVAL